MILQELLSLQEATKKATGPDFAKIVDFISHEEEEHPDDDITVKGLTHVRNGIDVHVESNRTEADYFFKVRFKDGKITIKGEGLNVEKKLPKSIQDAAYAIMGPISSHSTGLDDEADVDYGDED